MQSLLKKVYCIYSVYIIHEYSSVWTRIDSPVAHKEYRTNKVHIELRTPNSLIFLIVKYSKRVRYLFFRIDWKKISLQLLHISVLHICTSFRKWWFSVLFNLSFLIELIQTLYFWCNKLHTWYFLWVLSFKMM